MFRTAPSSLFVNRLVGKTSAGTRPIWASLMVAIAVIGFGSQAASAYTTPQLLADPSFELQPLTTIGNVLNFPFQTNQWGDEASTITGPVGAVSPSLGAKMLSMTTDGLVATQTLQAVDVSAYSADINAGLATADFQALFNVDKNVAAATAAIYVQFWDSSHNYVGATNINSVATLDANPATWEPISLTGVPIPATTKYLVAQVLYINATMNDASGANQPGFVDDTRLTLTATPEPSSLGLLAIGAASLLRIRRRK